jgi:methionyl-tRNA synthetase
MDKVRYFTTPIYYVNDIPHIGHAYTTVLADVMSRYSRSIGRETFFLTGTDEHGQKIKRAAEKARISPREQADRTVVRFKDLWTKLGIANDDFIRTTEDRHKEVVAAVLNDLYEKGDIYKAEYDGSYCVPCERFFTAKDLEENMCPDCGRPVEEISESNYFFRMGRYRDWLVSYIEEHPGFILPEFRKNETLGFLRQELNDLCISRPKQRLDWGIELPFDKDYVTYVWFDALLNYISAPGAISDPGRFGRIWPAVHFIGKDILTTHTVYWPIMLKAAGYDMPETVFAHGWWLTGDAKMSKSSGNVINPMDMIDKYGPDAFRYFLMAEMTPGQDAVFSEERFIEKYNSDLANDLGNLVSRVLTMIIKYKAVYACSDPEYFKNLIGEVRASVEAGFDSYRPDAALESIRRLVREANSYIEEEKPWALAKESKERLAKVLTDLAEIIYAAALMISPVMPSKSEEILSRLGTAGDTALRREPWKDPMDFSVIEKKEALFPRI